MTEMKKQCPTCYGWVWSTAGHCMNCPPVIVEPKPIWVPPPVLDQPEDENDDWPDPDEIDRLKAELAAERTFHAETREELEEARDDERGAVIKWLQSQLDGLGRYGRQPSIVAICIDLQENKHRKPPPKGSIEDEPLLTRTLAAEADNAALVARLLGRQVQPRQVVRNG